MKNQFGVSLLHSCLVIENNILLWTDGNFFPLTAIAPVLYHSVGQKFFCHFTLFLSMTPLCDTTVCTDYVNTKNIPYQALYII